MAIKRDVKIIKTIACSLCVMLFGLMLVACLGVFAQNYMTAKAMYAKMDSGIAVATPWSDVATSLEDIAPIKDNKASEADSGYVVDSNDNKLYYSPYTGMVFSRTAEGYSPSVIDGKPVNYDAEIDEFEKRFGAGSRDKYILVKNSIENSGKQYYTFGNYKVNDVKLTDKLFVVTVKANTQYNTGARFDMLIFPTFNKASLWESLIGILGKFSYRDIGGTGVDAGYLVAPSTVYLGSPIGIIIKAVGKWAGIEIPDKYGWIFGNVLDGIALAQNYFGTFADAVRLIEYADEIEDVPGVDYATDIFNHYLKDQRGGRLRIAGNGQLLDLMNMPVIGADAWPVWFDIDTWSYSNWEGGLLDHDNSGDYILRETEGGEAGFAIYSTRVFDKPIVRQLILADGITQMPALMRLVHKGGSIETNVYDFYDLNGVKIPEDAFIRPQIDDSREVTNPDEFDPDSIVSSILSAISNFFKSVFGSSVGKVILIVLVVIVVAVTAPLWIGFFKIIGFVLKSIFDGIKRIFEGIIGLFKH